MTIPAGAPLQVFDALAHPIRWELITLLAVEAQSATALARQLPVSRPATLKHLVILQDAGLVSRERAGREVRFVAHPRPIADAASWMSTIAMAWDHRLSDLKDITEGRRRGTTARTSAP
jgi:DNA-binding transcriptional ArsR family regulator